MSEATPPEVPGFREALRFWWKLGWISFGGPAGQVAIMHKEIVERRRWLSEDHFLHALNFCMLLPGPEAQQLATYLGWRLHGARGGIAAGVLFVLPSVFILLGLSWLYMEGGDIGWVNGIFHGLMAAVIAIVFSAVKRIGSKALKSPVLWALAGLSFVAIFHYKISFVIIILAAGCIGFAGGKFLPKQFPTGNGHGNTGEGDLPAVVLPPAPRAGMARTLLISGICLTLWWVPVIALGLLFGWKGIHFQQGLFFSKAALVTVGGAYAVLPYVSQMTVEKFGWLTQRQMMAGLGLAETTPGPLIMVVAFVGFLGGWLHQVAGPDALFAGAALGATVATFFTFLPSFVFILAGGPLVEATHGKLGFTAPLSAITAAVVGVIVNLALFFAWHVLWPQGMAGGFDWAAGLIAVGATLALFRFQVGVLTLLGASAAIGLAVTLLR